MFDILDIRRDSVLMQGEFPAELGGAFQWHGTARQSLADRRAARQLDGGAGLPRADNRREARLRPAVLDGLRRELRPARPRDSSSAGQAAGNAADVNFAILGDRERCTGDVARRAGNEYLYSEMVAMNVETLNEIAPRRIVVTCPHCLHNIGMEYPAFGGDYEIVHHTELIAGVDRRGQAAGARQPRRLEQCNFPRSLLSGRHNDVLDAPRDVLSAQAIPLIEMPRSRKNSFCCGAGGAQFWKEEEPGEQKVSLERYQEAVETGAETLAVGCPFCMRMFEDARNELDGGPRVLDIAEVLAAEL